MNESDERFSSSLSFDVNTSDEQQTQHIQVRGEARQLLHQLIQCLLHDSVSNSHPAPTQLGWQDPNEDNRESTAHVVFDGVVDGMRLVLSEPQPMVAREPLPSDTAPTEAVDASRSTSTSTGPESLSPREQEIARMVAKGYPTKTIAAVLQISPWTVSTHLRRIFVKLNVSSRAAMVARIAGM